MSFVPKSDGKDKKAYQAMVEPFLSQWPISEGKGKYTDKTTKAEIKAFLMNGFTMTMPRRVAKTSGALNKSKAPGTHTLGYQKEAAVQKAERAGEIQTSALFDQLEKGGISPIVAVRRIYISKYLYYLIFDVASGSSG
jgi:hypothetical protein